MGAVVLIAGLAVLPSAPALATDPNKPTVQVICEGSGGGAKTLRVMYPGSPVRNLHVLEPVSGGAFLYFYAPATANQIYKLAVPAGRYRLSYAALIGAGYAPARTYYGPVIVIPPFRVVRGICERDPVVGGGPSS